MKTTLNKIRKYSPCEGSWKKLLLSLNKTEADDEPLELQHILDTLGISDAVWSLRSIEGADREIRLFACDCAESVLPIYESKFPNDDRPLRAIEVARAYANGEATEDELAAARDAAGAAAGDAAWAAAWAAWAARDAAWAAWAARDAAGAAEHSKQLELFKKYFCITSIQKT